MNKKVIWLTGSMSAGKSTQRRNLCSEFATADIAEHTGTEDGKYYHFTSFGVISCIGKVKQTLNGDISMCDGLDSVFGKTKKEGGIYSVHKALECSKIVVLEGSQTSPSWATELQPILKHHKAEMYLVHLHMSYVENIFMLAKRQWDKMKAKDPDADLDDAEIDNFIQKMTDKNVESLIGKNRQFNNCYDKVEGLCHRQKIHALQPPDTVFAQIVDFVFG